MNPPLAAPIDPASGTIPLPRLSTILHPTKKQPLDQVCQTPPKGCFSSHYNSLQKTLFCRLPDNPCEVARQFPQASPVKSDFKHSRASNLLQVFSRQQSPARPPQLYAVGFAGFGSLSAMTFIRLSVHLIGSANFASPTTASLASSAGFSTPPRTSSTTAYL